MTRDRKKENGQALIEFVLILPIILFFMLFFVDLGRYFYTKIKVENNMSRIIELIQDEKQTIEEVKNIVKDELSDYKLTITANKENLEVTVSTDFTFITPGISTIFNQDTIEVERVILYEET